MTKKARLIEKLDSLSKDQKTRAVEFFTKYPNYENRVDWNKKALTYKDFENVFALAESSAKTARRKAKADPRVLFEKFNCEIIAQTKDFLIVTPLDHKCAVFMNSFNCGGEGAKWCIGDEDAPHWVVHAGDRSLFFLVLFAKKHPVLGKKVMVLYIPGGRRFQIYLADDTLFIGFRRLSDITRKIRGALRCEKEAITALYEKEIGKQGFFEFDISHTARMPPETRALFDVLRIAEILQKQLSRLNNGEALLQKIWQGSFLVSGGDTLERYYNPAEKTAHIPSGIFEIGYSAFFLCEELTKIVIPETVIEIHRDAFCECAGLEAFVVDKRNRRYSGSEGVLFNKKGDTLLYYPPGKKEAAYTIPPRIKRIEWGAFADCRNPNSIDVAPRNKSFAGIDGVLFNKKGDRLIRYPPGKKEQSYTIPPFVTQIDYYAFDGCGHLDSVRLPAARTAIKDFYFCRSLSSISVDAENNAYSSIDGVLFDKTGKVLIRYPAERKGSRYTVPSKVIAIADRAFESCEDLKTIRLPAGIILFRENAFSSCRANVRYRNSVYTDTRFRNSFTNKYLKPLESCSVEDLYSLLSAWRIFDCRTPSFCSNVMEILTLIYDKEKDSEKIRRVIDSMEREYHEKLC